MDTQDWGEPINFGMTSEHQCYVFRVRGAENNGRLHGFVFDIPQMHRFHPASYDHETECWYSTIALTKAELDQVYGSHKFVQLIDGRLEELPMYRSGGEAK